MATIDSLKQKANLIANATQVGENTAARVGGALQEAADLIAGLLTRASSTESKDSTQDGQIQALQTALGNLQTALNTEKSNREGADSSLQTALENLQQQLNTLVGGDASTAIDNFNEVIDFLNGVQDDETLTALMATINEKITALETTVGKNEAYIKLATELGYIDDAGNEQEELFESVDGAATPIPSNRKMRTGLVTLPTGSYRLSVSGSNAYMCKYYNGTFVEKIEITSPYEFSVVDDSLALPYGTKRFNQIRVTYTANYLSVGGTTSVYLFGSVGNLLTLLDNAKASVEELTVVQTALNEFKAQVGAVNGIAPLDYNGLIPAAYLPDDVFDVRMCVRWDNEVEEMTSAQSGSGYAYNTLTKKFYKAKFYGGLIDGVRYNGVYWFEEELSNKCIYVNTLNNVPYRWNGAEMIAIAPEDVPASIFNATTEKPITGYYVLVDTENTSMSAVHAAWNAKKAVSGLILSFELSAGIWKTYQYIGKTVTETNWMNVENWKDFGSLAAGSETYIIINDLIGAPVAGDYYTLETAVARLVAYQQTSGVNYAKKGLIIAYANGENTMETKQFQGEVSDFGEVGLWKDFGGGTKVETKDKTEKNGKDALSTGGAHELIPVSLDVDTETEGTVKLQMKNAEGDPVGDEVQFSVGTGSGGGSGTTIAVAYKDNPLYGRAGGSFVVKAAIMSVTKAGNNETSNSIMAVSFVNRTTKKVVAVFQPKKASSATMTDYSFEFDLSALCASAGELALQAVITDDGGNTATKNISLIAVDVTVESAQTLHYTRDTTLEVGGSAKNIPMYKFPNNASDKGILVKVEMYKDDEWMTLATTTVMDTYSHNVLISPSGLAHGAYPIRIQGEDVSSGVKGNVLHTAVMVIQQDETIADYNTPIVAARWSDDSAGAKQLLETVAIDVACYKRDNASPEVEVLLINETAQRTKTISEQVMQRNATYTVEHRLTDGDENDEMVLRARCGNVTQPEDDEFVIHGSLLPISETEGAFFKIGFDSRSNSDSDKSIRTENSDGGTVEIVVAGSNYSSNGFVKDSYGTTNYGTANDPGRMSLRIAEDVKATSNIKPFANTAIETNGSAFTFTAQVKNVADRDAVLMQCSGDKMGFVMTGEKLVVYTNGDLEDAATSCTVPFAVDMVHRFDIVIEPSARAPYGGIGVVKVFKDGDEVGAVKYTAGAFPNTDASVEWDGTDADFYLYEVGQWNTYYNFMQAFYNYLIGQKDTEAMIAEYEKNDVMASQTAEGTTKDRPSMQKFLDAGIPVVVLTKSAGTDDIAKNYPDYLEGLDGDKKTTIPLDWYCYFPGREWQNCIITEDPTSNQGTTSSWRKIKNKKGKHKKAKSMRLMYTRAEIAEMYPGDDEVLAKYDLAARMAAKNKLQVVEGGQFTNINTIKVDYSDSSGAHNGAMMDLMNETQIALGSDYMTPAQVYNEGDFEIHTSIDSIPCALFRTDHNMTAVEATDPANAYFHAKANFNADKGDAAFYGFEKTAGYNAACLNYGDFIELVAAKNQSLNDFKTATLADVSSLIAGNIYVLSEYCGPGHVVLENDGTGSMQEVGAVDNPTEIDKTFAEMRAASVGEYSWNVVYLTLDGKYVQYQGGVWQDTTGTMTFNNATKKWSVTGRVVNPVECYELLKYDYLCWMQGVNSVEDMMVIDETTGNPIWMSYYESRYPDDDDLNDKYERGVKAPYQLYRWLMFCQQCNQNLTSADGNITLDGASVAGTAANRLMKWEHDLHKYANVKSLLCYTVASDYKAAVDQRSKNMMIAFYLETNGLMRAYLNHWYDGDCVDGSDNDCGLTIPWDMDARTSHLYQGWDSVIFKQNYAAGNIWLDDEGAETVTLSSVAGSMRRAERNNIRVFSAEGCRYYWLTKRLEKWAKVVSSFDGERKYIQNSTAADNYFYALHGLRLDDLPDYQTKRFKYCDGQYQVGDLYTNPFKARMMGTIEITITAAQDGFFGLGEDRADVCADSCHLLAGESYTMRVNAAQESGKMIYIFGADKLAKLDISKCTPKLEGFSLEYCTLLEELVIGGASYTPAYTTGILSALELPAMPFLKKLDIRNTKIATLSAKNCPRLREVYATGTPLRTFAPSESSPLTTLQLPATMTALSFVNLPNLTYPNGGLTMAGMSALKSIRLSGCPNIDIYELLNAAVNGGATISEVSLAVGSITKPCDVLVSLMNAGVKGIGSEQTTVCDGISGRWVLPSMMESEDFAGLQRYYPELVLVNSLYSDYVESDNESSPQRITNMDNHTGYKYGVDYVASGHVKRIREKCKPVAGKLNTETMKMALTLLSVLNYAKDAEGNDFDVTDALGQLYDIYIYLCHYWYKGINDFKNQEKHTLLSSNKAMPAATWTRKNEAKLSDILYSDNSGLLLEDVAIGETFTDEDHVSVLASCAVYRMDVEGMKQVRYIGLNNASYGSVFVGADGEVLQKDNLSIVGTADSPLDFKNENGDYIFRDVPTGAKWIYFTCLRGLTDEGHPVISVDSSDIEAIEPGWVEHKSEVVGVYGITLDDLGLPRSISGRTTKRGDGTSQTSTEWRYDEEGNAVNMPIGTVHYTMQDFMNAASYRKLQNISYEQNKDISVLSRCFTGNIDDQRVYGFGCSSGYVTGLRDNIGMADTVYGSYTNTPNKVWGLEGFIACNYEWMDCVGVNINNFASWKARKRVDNDSVDPVDAKWHIFDPRTKTERVVQGITDTNGRNIARVKHGKYCDIIPSSTSADTSKYNLCYAAGQWYTASRGRVVGRADYRAYASGGLVFASANYASSSSNAYYGSRLAFCGQFENESDIDEDA